MNNKNIRYITGLFGFVMSLWLGFYNGSIDLFSFGGRDGYNFRLTLSNDFVLLVYFFIPYILAKIWQSYKAES